VLRLAHNRTSASLTDAYRAFTGSTCSRQIHISALELVSGLRALNDDNSSFCPHHVPFYPYSEQGRAVTMREFVRVVASPLQRAWAGLALQRSESVPRPTDQPQSFAAGPDHDRVLVFGSGPAAGWGVRTHDLALPGALARALHVQTGRGADVCVAANPAGSITHGRRALGSVDVTGYDAIIVVLGVTDAVELRSPTIWRTELTQILKNISDRSDDRTQIYVLGIQPIRTIPVFNTVIFGTLADRHATTLNRLTERLCAATPHTTFVPLTGRSFIVSGRYRTSTDYQRWGESLATDMAAGLTETSRSRR
jgi:hypothetical protein